MHILMFVLNFFKRLSERYEVEALVHILYDTIHRKYTLRVPKQELTAVSVDSVMEEDYPDYLIHVMDIHSHNTMPAKFSDTDDRDEKATRLYAVAGRFDQVFPEIAVRASCGGGSSPCGRKRFLNPTSKPTRIRRSGKSSSPSPNRSRCRLCRPAHLA